MNRIKYMFLHLLLFFIVMNTCYSQEKKSKNTNETIKESLWKGFVRLDFKIDQKKIRLIKPNKSRHGNPWLWRARFPDWHTETDSILVSEGFHLVYVNTDHQFGSPNAVSIWNDVYRHLTGTYQLNNKVALAGVSRGGLFVYNWAKENPEKVACIYTEAPVCDFKSWPAGFGKSKGSEADWEILKKEYGFHSDEEAKAYTNNPIDNLGVLAKAKIPVLHMIGLKDSIVPPSENTIPLINKYIALGGPATVAPCTKGEQKLEGHHFPIETPGLVADFIKYHTLENAPLKASNYHVHRAGLKNSKIKFERTKEARVAFLGGSITYNGGWRDSLMVYFKKRFPKTKFDFIAAGIPSMGTTPHAFRLQRDVLSKGKIDLLFVEAAVNDAANGRTDIEQIRAMEGVIRHARNSNPAIDIVMMHFVDPEKMTSYRKGEIPQVIKNHEKVAKRYNVPTLNLAKEVTERIDTGEFTWENDFKNLHPSPFGQGIYAKSMLQFLDHTYAGFVADDDKISNYVLPKKVDPFCYDNGKLINIASVKLSKGWEIDPLWIPTDGTGTRTNYTNVPMLIAKEIGRTLKVKFTGNVIGIAVAAGQDAGAIEYRIDNGRWQKLNLFTRWSKHLHLPWYYTLASELNQKKHRLEIRVVKKKDLQSSGNACRIRYFFVN